MNCPSCHRPVDIEARSCYTCDYSIEKARAVYGTGIVKLEQIHDAADCLRIAEIHLVRDLFAELERRYPQLSFAVYLADFPPAISLGEFGFWLLNHSEIESDRPESKGNAIVLILDTARKQAGLSMDYLPELLITEEVTLNALLSARSLLINGEYGNAITTIFRKIERSLNREATQLSRMDREAQAVRLLARENENRLIIPEHQRASLFELDHEDSTADETFMAR